MYDNRSLHIDTKSLEKLTKDLAIFPDELNKAMISSIKSGVSLSLKKTITKYYALNPQKLARTYKIRNMTEQTNDEYKLIYEISGRKLTPTHFNVSPLAQGTAQPLIEIIKGRNVRASKRMGADGKMKTPFVMSTGATSSGKEHFNVFRDTGKYGQKKLRAIKKKDGTISVFTARVEKLKPYRTVSVPQMLFHKNVRDEVSENILAQLEKNFEKRANSRIEKRLMG